MKTFFAVKYRILKKEAERKRKWYTLFLKRHIVVPAEIITMYSVKDVETLGKDFDVSRLTVGTQVPFLGHTSLTWQFGALEVKGIQIPSASYSVIELDLPCGVDGLRISFETVLSQEWRKKYEAQGWKLVNSLSDLV